MCHVASTSDKQVSCAPGTWSNVTGLGTPCTQPCRAGYVCDAASTAPDQQSCGGRQFFCPLGSAALSPVQIGYYSYGGNSDTTQTAEAMCPSPDDDGSNGTAVYCPGDGYIHVCPGGTFGTAKGMSTSACSGSCRAGYYCPAGSVNSTASPCGSTDM